MLLIYQLGGLSAFQQTYCVIFTNVGQFSGFMEDAYNTILCSFAFRAVNPMAKKPTYLVIVLVKPSDICL